MSRSFNALRRTLYGLRLDPFVFFLFPCCIFLGLALITMSFGWLFASLLCAVLWSFLQWAATHGWPRIVARALTPNFYAVRGLSGRWTILQRRVHLSRAADCSALLRGLIEEQRRLPAALTPGRYCTLTHDTVLRRLKALDYVQKIASYPAYTADMAKLRIAMTGGKCRRCKRRCPFPTGGDAARQFYFITFIVSDLNSLKAHEYASFSTTKAAHSLSKNTAQF